MSIPTMSAKKAQTYDEVRIRQLTAERGGAVSRESPGQVMTTPIIKIATASDEAPAIDVVVLAFSADPAARWTWPDPQQYLTHFPPFVEAFGGKAFAHGSAYYVDGYAGAALWLPPGVHPDEDALITFLQRTVSEQKLKDVFAAFEQMGRYHPSEPHWYLPLIGVDPFHQGKGYGAALMQHALIPCDRDHTLAYLESTNPKNIPLCERHGFELLGTIQVGTSAPLFSMLRKPRSHNVHHGVREWQAEISAFESEL